MHEEAGRRFGAQGRASVCSGGAGEGPDCLCSRASLGNWNVWVHGVQEDPLGPIAVKRQRNCAVASRNAGRSFVRRHGGVAQSPRRRVADRRAALQAVLRPVFSNRRLPPSSF